MTRRARRSAARSLRRLSSRWRPGLGERSAPGRPESGWQASSRCSSFSVPVSRSRAVAPPSPSSHSTMFRSAPSRGPSPGVHPDRAGRRRLRQQSRPHPLARPAPPRRGADSPGPRHQLRPGARQSRRVRHRLPLQARSRLRALAPPRRRAPARPRRRALVRRPRFRFRHHRRIRPRRRVPDEHRRPPRDDLEASATPRSQKPLTPFGVPRPVGPS